MANTQMNKRGRAKTDIFDRVFAPRLVIVYQGLVRITESFKEIFSWGIPTPLCARPTTVI